MFLGSLKRQILEVNLLVSSASSSLWAAWSIKMDPSFLVLRVSNPGTVGKSHRHGLDQRTAKMALFLCTMFRGSALF